MKKALKLLSLFSIILFQNCNLNDCNQACFTPPNPFLFEFVDAPTNENLFTNTKYVTKVPEFRGELISGKIVDKISKKPISDVNISMTITGKEYLFKISETDKKYLSGRQITKSIFT